MLLRSDDPIFQGNVTSWTSWRSGFPDIDTYNFFSATGDFLDTLAGKSVLLHGANEATVQGIRNCTRDISITFGYFQSALPLLETLYEGASDILARNLETLESVLGAVTTGLTAVPVIGWIIKVVYEMVTFITDIVKNTADKRSSKALNALARKASIPMTKWVAGADTFLGQAVQDQLLAGNTEWMISPRFLANKGSDFIAVIQRGPNSVSGTDRDTCTDGYLVYPGKFSSDEESFKDSDGGLGFVPGTQNIHAAMQLPTAYPGKVTDIGEFSPSTRTLAASVWGEILAVHSGLMFSVNTDRVSDRWANYIRASQEFAHERLKRGWSGIEGNLVADDITLASIYECTWPCTEHMAGCTRKLQSGNIQKIPGTGHYNAFLSYFRTLFDQKRLDRNGGWELDNIDWYDTRPGRALQNLSDRQKAKVDSMSCMYIDDVGDKFSAITRSGTGSAKGPHWDLWNRNVRAVFESGEWSNVNYLDVIPDGTVDRAIKDRLANMGTTPGEYFDAKGKAIPRGSGPAPVSAKERASVLSNPKAPAPADIVDIRPARKPTGAKKGGGGIGLGLGVAAVAAVGGAYYLKKKKRRR